MASRVGRQVCSLSRYVWVATLKAMAGGTSEAPNTAPPVGLDRTTNLGIGDLDSNANDAVLQMVACKVNGSQSSSDDGFQQEHSAGDSWAPVSGKSRELFGILPDIGFVLILCIYSNVQICCSAVLPSV